MFLTLACISLAGPQAAAWTDEAFDQYFQRKDTVTSSAGNAHEANTVTHVIDPWPRHVGNTRIPANGERMSDAIERYMDVSKLPRAPRPIAPIYGTTVGVSSTGSTGGQ